MPVVAGYALGLSQPEVADTLQRTLVLCGIISILQTALGHRYPIIDGPAGLWSGILLLMAQTMDAFGKSGAVLRTDLETGMIIGGAVIIILVLLGLMKKTCCFVYSFNKRSADFAHGSPDKSQHCKGNDRYYFGKYRNRRKKYGGVFSSP